VTKLILTTSDSGAGHLKFIRIADTVIPATHRLVSGPTPADSGAEFFASRKRMAPDEWGDDEGHEGDASAIRSLSTIWGQLEDLCDTFEAVELWIDPTPNAQLVMAQLLDRLSRHSGLIGKLSLVHPDTPLGELKADGTVALLTRRPVVQSHLVIASAVWRALAQPTPQAFVQLLNEDLSIFPHLRSAVIEVIQELPDSKTALTATESNMLALIRPGAVSPSDLFPGHMKKTTRRVFDYWETGQILDRLAQASAPAVLGLSEGPFTLELHDDQDRYNSYRQSRLRLSDLGERLAEGRDDISRHNKISRWWGGVKLTNDSLWRWDAAQERLIAPG
jgi:hypothetical protein